MTFEKWKIYEVKTKAEIETPAGDRDSGGVYKVHIETTLFLKLDFLRLLFFETKLCKKIFLKRDFLRLFFMKPVF